MTRSILLTLLTAASAVVLQPAPARAQWVAPVSARTSAASDVGPRSAPAARGSAGIAAPGRYFTVRRIATIAGGSALGAALGYFSSQVRMSDWDTRAREAEGHSMRRRYSVGGAVAGATLGFVVPVGRAPRLAGGQRLSASSIILSSEVKGRGASNAYDAVQSLRPRWLVKMQVLSLGDAVGDVGAAAEDRAASGDVSILVYLNHAKMGGIETLRDIPLTDVQYIRYYTGPEATYKWGWGHAQGVIQVSTQTLEEGG